SDRRGRSSGRRRGTAGRRAMRGRRSRTTRTPSSTNRRTPHALSPARPKDRAREARHSTHPPVACLGRSLLTSNVCKGRRVRGAPATAPSGGRSWHGSAVRRPLLGGGGVALTFGLLGAYSKHLGAHPMHRALSRDIEGVRTEAQGPNFFTERTL